MIRDKFLLLATVITMLLLTPFISVSAEKNKAEVIEQETQKTEEPLNLDEKPLEPISETATDEQGTKVDSKTENAEIFEAQKGNAKEKPGDRRWIIKERRGYPVERAPQKPSKKLVWSDSAQEVTCNTYLKQVTDLFLNARYYSIKGDACKTAEYAKSFNLLAAKCNADCPEGFLRIKGYPDRTMRNLKRLEELGTKRCFQGDRQIEGTKTNAKQRP